MKNNLLLLLSFLSCSLAQGQAFSFELWFEDAAGNKDTIVIGYDAEATWGIDPQFGEADIKDQAFRPSLDVRLADYDYFGGVGEPELLRCEQSPWDPTFFHTKTRIYPGECEETPESEASLILLANPVFPVTMSWDPLLFQDSCRNQSFVTGWPAGGWFDVACGPGSQNYYMAEHDQAQLIQSETSYLVPPQDTVYAYWFAFRGDANVGLKEVELPPALHFHPNPFTNELSLLAPPERPLRVDVFGMDGRAHGSYRAQEGRLQLGHLPGGAYVLRVSDVRSGAFLGTQQVVKVGR
jgi:hypothetical protein